MVQQDDQRRVRTSQLAGELRVLIGQLRRRMQDRGSNLGDLTSSQVAILIRLERDGPATVSQLARAEGMRPQSMGANVAALEAAGLVCGKPDPTDGRQSFLSLTSTCRELVRTGRLAREDWLSSAINRALSPDEQDDLARAVKLLRRIAEA